MEKSSEVYRRTTPGSNTALRLSQHNINQFGPISIHQKMLQPIRENCDRTDDTEN